MLKERARLLNLSVFLLDLALVAVAFVAAHWLRSGVLPRLAHDAFPGHLLPLSEYLPLLPVALAIWGGLLLHSDAYRSHRTEPLLREAWSIVRLSGAALVIFTLVLYALRFDEQVLEDDRVSRAWLALFGLLTFLLLLGEKIVLRTASRWVRSRGYNYRTLLIVGSGPGAAAIARSIQAHDYWGFQLLGCIAVEGQQPASVAGVPVLGQPQDIPRLLQEHVVDDVIFAVGRKELGEMENLVLALEEQGIRTLFALNFFPHSLARVELSEIDGVPLLTFSTAPTNLLLLLMKRLLDVSLAALVLLLSLPVILGVALAIKLTSGGSVLFRQTRCGLNGRRFVLYKFRTMVEDAERRRTELLHLNEMDGPVFKVRNDPRVTRLGRLLRRFSLDELPQLWNVLRGDMSLVGPRPPIPEEVAQYERWQRRRLSMKPGLTCLWQIGGRNGVPFRSWIELDLEYIDSWSLLLDLKILLKTVPVVLSGRGAS
ncbi:MAG TPA: sugar transferase [Thermoanaerobaculia bacterium]|nr:sugar transferase [Thermoanaerobaculia bacterium]